MAHKKALAGSFLPLGSGLATPVLDYSVKTQTKNILVLL